MVRYELIWVDKGDTYYAMFCHKWISTLLFILIQLNAT